MHFNCCILYQMLKYWAKFSN